MIRKSVLYLNHFQILNIPSRATGEEIQEAYLYLTSIYSDGSIAVYGAINDTEKRWMIKRIQKAHDTLIDPKLRKEYIISLKETDWIEPDNGSNGDSLSPEPSTQAPPPLTNQKQIKPVPTKINASSSRISGAHLRNIRMARGSTLDDIATITKVKKGYLVALEEDDFASFPAPVFMKGFLKSYASALGLNPEEISKKYFKNN